ncbi:MAG: glutaconyl-CoA decarboxylase subunit alpha, partial [Betaproteobacteria bacterium]
MRPYFENMPGFGKALKENRIARTQDSRAKLEAVEAEIGAARKAKENIGIPAEQINQRGSLTVWQRLEYLVDAGTWHPLHSLYNPADNAEGSTNVVDGLGRIGGRWAVIIGFDNKWLAGAWVPGQSENILRVTDIAKRLNLPLVWFVHCSGVQMPAQEKFYADRRGGGTCFFRHAELQQLGIPILAGIFGTNPAGGGYQAISPTILLAHKDANMAVGGAGIVSGMAPRGGFDVEGLEQLIAKTREFKERPPGRTEVHYDQTGFFARVFDDDKAVLDGLKEYVKALPAYDPMFFRVAEPKEPALPAAELYHLLPFNQKETYSFDELLARLVDGSEHLEFRPGYGPEVYTGLVKLDGMLVGVIGNRQGLLPKGYPEYADYPGIGG